MKICWGEEFVIEEHLMKQFQSYFCKNLGGGIAPPPLPTPDPTAL